LHSVNHQIELKILEIGPVPMAYHFEKEHICLFITASKSVEMPMGQRSVPLPPNSVYLFYDQKRNFDLAFKATENADLCIIKLPIDTLHHIIALGTDELNFSQSAIFEKEQYHHFEPANENIKTSVAQLLKNPSNVLFKESKKFEILDYYFNSKNVTTYKCPFLNQKDNVNKVRQAKEILITDLRSTITIKELAKEVGLNEYNLKTGFKEIYGKPVHTYLKDYKIAQARELIETKDYQINEIADNLGYSNVSHFIEAFKKKYGVTPKQFELSC
jgi:AraC family transcriptional activator of pyochelin receptor